MADYSLKVDIEANDQASEVFKKCSDSADQFKSSLESTGQKMTKVGGVMSVSVTAPLTAAAAASKGAWTEVDEAMDTVVTKTGATGDALEDMQKRAKDLATTIPTSFQTAGDAIGEVNTRFGLTGDALEDLSKQFIEFSSINNTDVSTSIDSVQAAMAAFGVSSEDAGLMLDTLNKAGQDTGVSVTQLADDMTHNANALQELGFNASDSAMFLANLSKSGVDSSTVMTGLSMALKNATKDGKSTKDALADMQTQMSSAKSETEAMQIATELFGSRGGASIGKYVYEGKLNLAAMGTSLSDYAGNVQTTFDATLDPIDKQQVAMNELKETGAELFTSIQTVMQPVMEEAINALHTFNDWFTNLDPGMKELIVKIGMVAAAAGPVLAIGGKIISGGATVVGAIEKIGGGVAGLVGHLTGLGSGASSAVSSIGSVASAAGSAAGPVTSAAAGFGTLAGQSLQLVAVGASLAIAAVGIKLIAESAIEVANAGPGAAVAMVAMVGAIVGLAAGAAAVGPALTAGSVGLVAFGAAVALVGAGIGLATTGIANLAGQLPTVATYGSQAATSTLAISAAMTALAGSTALVLVPMAGMATATLGADGALLALDAEVLVGTAAMIGLNLALVSMNTSMESISDAASSASASMKDIQSSLDVTKAGVTGLGDLFTKAVTTIISAFTSNTGNAQSAGQAFGKAITTGVQIGIQPVQTNTATTISKLITTVNTGSTKVGTTVNTGMTKISTSVQTGMTKITTQVTTGGNKMTSVWTNDMNKMNQQTQTSMNSMVNKVQSSLNKIQSMFSNTRLSFNQRIALPHFSMHGRFDAQSGSVPSVGVSWYKKAYDQAMTFSMPTIIGNVGFGDGNGPETVVGDDHLAQVIKDSLKETNNGTLVIPVYIGNERIDEIVVNAQDRNNYRSGGR